MSGRTKRPRNQANASRMTTRSTVSGQKCSCSRTPNKATMTTKWRNTVPLQQMTYVLSIVSAVAQAFPNGTRELPDSYRSSWDLDFNRCHQQNNPHSSQVEDSTITMSLLNNADHDDNPVSGHNNSSLHGFSKLIIGSYVQYSTVRLRSLAAGFVYALACC